MTQRMMITGASGFIGRQLVPKLKARGFKLTVVGRDLDKLDNLFPGLPHCSYEQFEETARNFDVVVHLAVLNNDTSASAEEFDAANVGLLSMVVEAAKAAGVKYFVNVTTFHALEGRFSVYANSKRRALEMINKFEGISIINLFLPAVYGHDYSGRMAIIKMVPPPLRRAAFLVLTAMVPTLNIDRLALFFADHTDGIKTHVMLADPQDENPVYLWVKRAIDFLFAAFVIMVFGWLLAIIWVLVRFTSDGPGIFAQQRVGQDGTQFTCYKFRTMRNGTKQVGTHETSSDAVTPVGALLRKTKIDELPQVWNIMRGEVSLVGPRPCLPVQKSIIEARKQLDVLSVRPGITGFAQIKGIDMSDPVKLASADAFYAANRGLLFDFQIIVATLIGRGQGDQVR